MPLIKCKGCGQMVSDRATVCPHCGHPVKDSIEAAKAKVEEPQTVDEPQLDTPPVETPMQQAQPVYYEDEEPKKASKALIVIDIILAIIAVGFGCYLLGSGKLPHKETAAIADSTAIDTTSQTAPVVEETPQVDETVQADTALPQTESQLNEPQEEEKGFKTASDVEGFVVGQAWRHDDVTLTITNEAIFANGNKISTSRPKFTRRANKLGEITARPNISISVKYDEFELVDNNNGDLYEQVDPF